MKKGAAFLALLSTICAASMASSLEPITVRTVTCVSGNAKLDKTVFHPGQLSSIPGLKYYKEAVGSVVAVAGTDVVLALPFSGDGDNDGVCPNDNKATFLIVTAGK